MTCMLVAALVAQALHAPPAISRAQVYHYETHGIERIAKLDRRMDDSRVHSFPAGHEERMLRIDPQAYEPLVLGPQRGALIDLDFDQPYRGAAYVCQNEHGATLFAVLDSHVQNAALKVLHGTDGASTRRASGHGDSR